MSVPDPLVAIDDISQSLALITDFTTGQVFESFTSDLKTQFAVVRCLEIIGEATKRLPEDFRSRHPDIPWKIMAGMRDRLIHGYDVVDPTIIWKTIQVDIPELKRLFARFGRTER